MVVDTNIYPPIHFCPAYMMFAQFLNSNLLRSSIWKIKEDLFTSTFRIDSFWIKSLVDFMPFKSLNYVEVGIS